LCTDGKWGTSVAGIHASWSTVLALPARFRPVIAVLVFAALLPWTVGCAFGPKALECTHGRYNESVKHVTEEQLLLNIVRLRYNDNPLQLDVSSIAAQYELDASLQAQPFFSTEATGDLFRSFSTILPFAGIEGANRPTVSMTPLDDAEVIRGLFKPSSLDGVIFLAETSWPISTVFRLWVEHLNRVPNAVAASGPPREVVSEFRDFQAAVQLLQVLQDRGDIRFIREERLSEIGSPLQAASVTATALVEAAKNGFEYRERQDKTWVLVRRDRQLSLRLAPTAVNNPEVHELCRLLNLKPGLRTYEIAVGGSGTPLAEPEQSATINLYPRSTAQSLFYMSHGVLVPPQHLDCGVVKAALEPDGTVFDWRQVTEGLFTVHAVKQHGRPACAFVAVHYRGHWFYIDDRDNNSKITFALMMVMTRANLLAGKQGGPALTLPVGR
jgi:hypothetical protein